MRAVASTFGRADDLAYASELLTEERVPLLSVTGRAGVGKTHFALELLAQCARDAVVVPLAGVGDAALVPSQLAAALDVPSLPGRDALDLVARRIGDDPTVLLLDNFEQVLPAASGIGALIDRCPQLRMVVTSQSPLHLRAERVLALQPLPAPSSGALADLRNEPAVALYCERARAVHRDFRLTDANAPAIAQLCRVLEGLPLAIELAAARAHTLAPRAVLDPFDVDTFDLLQNPRVDGPARHHDLRSAIAWTYRLLAKSEQSLLRRLAVVSGGFDIDDAAALTNDMPTSALVDGLSTLVDFHFVDPIADDLTARFVMPSSIRAFATEDARQRGEYEEIRGNQVAWRAARARALAAAIDDGAEAIAFDELRPAHDDFIDALHGAMEQSDTEAALDLTRALAPYWQARGYHQAHEELLETVLLLAEKARIENAAHADALAWSAGLGIRLRIPPDSERLVARLDEAERIARKLGDDTAIFRVLSFRMLTVPATGDLAGGLAAGREGRERASTRAHEPWLARFEMWSAAIAHQLAQDEDALELGRRALLRARRVGDQRTVVAATIVLRPMVATYPELDDELPTLTEVLEIARRLGLALYEAGLLAALAIDAAATGDVAAANEWCADALEFVRGSADSPLIGFSLVAAIDVATARGNYELAATLHGVVRGARALLQANSGREQADAHGLALATASRALGSERFAGLARRGEGVPWGDALEQALAFVRDHDAPQRVEPTLSPPSALTPRQIEVVRLLAAGLRNKEIADRLELTPKTVMHHLTGVYRVLGVRGRSEATAWAYRTGLVE
jgi:predicted ATPase/DNA-binding CsgD family transcriptional regulator